MPQCGTPIRDIPGRFNLKYRNHNIIYTFMSSLAHLEGHSFQNSKDSQRANCIENLEEVLGTFQSTCKKELLLQ